MDEPQSEQPPVLLKKTVSRRNVMKAMFGLGAAAVLGGSAAPTPPPEQPSPPTTTTESSPLVVPNAIFLGTFTIEGHTGINEKNEGYKGMVVDLDKLGLVGTNNPRLQIKITQGPNNELLGFLDLNIDDLIEVINMAHVDDLPPHCLPFIITDNFELGKALTHLEGLPQVIYPTEGSNFQFDDSTVIRLVASSGSEQLVYENNIARRVPGPDYGLRTCSIGNFAEHVHQNPQNPPSQEQPPGLDLYKITAQILIPSA
jgi:hypothetical protein